MSLARGVWVEGWLRGRLGRPDDLLHAFPHVGRDDGLEPARCRLVTQPAVAALRVEDAHSVEGAGGVGADEGAGPLLHALVRRGRL